MKIKGVPNTIHRGNTPITPEQKAEMVKQWKQDPPPIRCEFCGKPYYSKPYFKIHLENFHPEKISKEKQ